MHPPRYDDSQCASHRRNNNTGDDRIRYKFSLTVHCQEKPFMTITRNNGPVLHSVLVETWCLVESSRIIEFSCIVKRNQCGVFLFLPAKNVGCLLESSREYIGIHSTGGLGTYGLTSFAERGVSETIFRVSDEGINNAFTAAVIAGKIPSAGADGPGNHC